MSNNNNNNNNQTKNPQAGQGQPLPKKEGDLFRAVVKHYEMKQYKKGLKACEAILKKFAMHGETLCMKGLILNCIKDRKAEAIDIVKLGLRNDMRSHVCWHVYGLIHRANRQYNEAIKAYKQALRIDTHNIQILRDLSLLQIQMRDLHGFVLTRLTILDLKPNQKMNWLTLSLAKHLIGDRIGASEVLNVYLKTLDPQKEASTDTSNDGKEEVGEQEIMIPPPEFKRGYESSELALYRNLLLGEMKKWDEALQHLDECKHLIVDEVGWYKSRAYYQLQLGLFQDAKDTYMELFIDGLTEDYTVHSGYMAATLELDADTCAQVLDGTLQGNAGTGASSTMMNHTTMMLPLTNTQRQVLHEQYQTVLRKSFPKSNAIRRMPLLLLSHESDEWKVAIDEYCRLNLSRGVPSLGSDLSALLLVPASPATTTTTTTSSNDKKSSRLMIAKDVHDIAFHPIYLHIVQLVDGYIASLTQNSTFSKRQEEEQEQKEDIQQEAPSVLLWTWYLRAYLHDLAGEYEQGIQLIDQCLEQTPTAVDAYELKGLLLKHGGNVHAAAECVDKGRDLDRQDRYINNLATKYYLQADRHDVALERISMFTRHESNPTQNIFDMQCTWYELELAASHERKEEWGKSLKKFMAVEKHFEDFHEDQFDFHSYCIRKVTLRAYLSVLRWEDTIWGHDYYVTAAEGIIRIYKHLFDNPEILEKAKDVTPDYSSMTAAQRKKAKAQARKKKKAAEKKAEAQRLEDEKKGNSSNAAATKDADPNGQELVKRDPLEELKKYTATLVKNSPNRPMTWIIQYDIAIRRGKVMMALQALHKAKSLDPDSSDLLTRIVDFASKDTSPTSENAVVQQVYVSEKASLLENKSLNEFISTAKETITNDRSSSLASRLVLSKALISSKISSIEDIASIIMGQGLNIRGVTFENCQDVTCFIQGLGKEAEAVLDRWNSLMKQRFPYS